MTRPAFIVAEPEPEQALSTRKILLETFKYNVITVHSVSETLDLVRLLPNVQALIIHCGIPDFDADSLIQSVKESTPKLPIIALTPTQRELKWADHVVQSHSPQELLSMVQGLFGDPVALPGRRMPMSSFSPSVRRRRRGSWRNSTPTRPTTSTLLATAAICFSSLASTRVSSHLCLIAIASRFAVSHCPCARAFWS